MDLLIVSSGELYGLQHIRAYVLSGLLHITAHMRPMQSPYWLCWPLVDPTVTPVGCTWLFMVCTSRVLHGFAHRVIKGATWATPCICLHPTWVDIANIPPYFPSLPASCPSLSTKIHICGSWECCASSLREVERSTAAVHGCMHFWFVHLWRPCTFVCKAHWEYDNHDKFINSTHS